MVKLIIDTDPGVDDAMAILSAFNTEDVEIVGITTLFGNVPVHMATENALILRDLMLATDARAAEIPICQGSSTSFLGMDQHRIADFVHGQDGLGNRRPEKSTASPSSESAVDFIVRMLNENPGEITILALAACTNIAFALKKDPQLHNKWKELVILGGAFHINGNVNPAAEANILGDAEAADYVFARGLNTYVVGLDVTMSCALTREQLESMRGKGRFGTFLADISGFYCDFHFKCYNQDIVFLHDPAAMLAVTRKDLFQWEQGPAIVACEGHMRGKTLVDLTTKNWFEPNAWMERPKIKVAIKAEAEAVSSICMELMSK